MLGSVKGESKTVVGPKSSIVLTRKGYLVFITLLKLAGAELICSKVRWTLLLGKPYRKKNNFKSSNFSVITITTSMCLTLL